jgi:hypothetical protein
MNKLFFIPVLALFMGSCTVSKFSNKQKNDETVMHIAEDETFIASSGTDQPLARGVKSRGFITLAMVGKLASVGADVVKKVIDNEKKKYTAEYSDGLSGLYFYSHLSEKNVWDPDGIQLKEFTFIRTFKDKKGNLDTALRIVFMLDTANAFEIYNNGIFKLKTKDVKIYYAKAKVPTKHWYFPWSYLQKNKNDKLDMDIEIEFTSTYNTEDGIFMHNASLGKFYLLIRDAPLDKKDPGYKTYYDSLSNVSLDGYSFIVPRSFGHFFDGNEFKPCYSQGNYAITIRVKESGQEKYVDKMIMDNSGVAIDAIANQAKKLK